MKKLGFVLALAISAAACSREDALEIPAGSQVTVQKKDGVRVEGKLVEIQASQVIVESRAGVKTTVPRAEIAQVSSLTQSAPAAAEEPAKPAEKPVTSDAPVATTSEPRPAPPLEADKRAATAAETPAPAGNPTPEFREVTLPTGTELPLTLRSSVGSATSNLEDQVRATLRSAVRINGVEALPAGTAIIGHVTDAKRSAKVKGRATVAFRFTRVDLPGEGGMTN